MSRLRFVMLLSTMTLLACSSSAGDAETEIDGGALNSAPPLEPMACTCNVAACQGCSPDPSSGLCTSRCTSTEMCSGGTCVPKVPTCYPTGHGCPGSLPCCGGEACVDGVCCSVSSCPACQKCNIAGQAGHCWGVPAGPGPGCGGSTCSAGTETDYACNAGGGTCVSTTASCGAFACSGASCGKTCAGDGDCAAGGHCIGGSCFSALTNGSPCTAGGVPCVSGNSCVEGVCCSSSSCASGASCKNPGHVGTCTGSSGADCGVDTDCATGICTDKKCCDLRCSGQCQACNVAGHVGTCTTLPPGSAPVAPRAACATSAAGKPYDAACAPTCNGADATKCNFKPTTTTCGTGTCTGGIESDSGTCASGYCAGGSKSCDPYVCGPSTCKTTCVGDVDCSAGHFCSGGLCVNAAGLGKPCTSASSCGSSLFCTDGFCCGAASCESGASCGIPSHEGSCTKVGGTTCSADAECGTGNCVDGVCCDTKCTGECEACDIPDSTTGRPGKCIPVKGKPHGTRAACPTTDPSNPCAAATCDGSTTSSCVGYSGADTQCRAASCKDGSFTASANCDGKGHCPDPISSSCAEYACAADGSRCDVACTTDADCAATFHCKDGKCNKTTATCSGDGLSSIALDGTTKPCAPYRCKTDGTCAQGCGTSDDCAPGNNCGSDGKCSPADSATASSGGCEVVVGERGGYWAAWALGLIVAGLVTRRRHRG